jgi:hypothetical protein
VLRRLAISGLPHDPGVPSPTTGVLYRARSATIQSVEMCMRMGLDERIDFYVGGAQLTEARRRLEAWRAIDPRGRLRCTRCP